MKKRTILLYGRSSSGKSTQIGALAEHIYKTLGLKTRLATSDRGGVGPIQPYIDLGIVEAIEMGETDPFLFLNKTAKGYVRDASGKWVLGDNSHIGMFAFESLRAFAEAMMQNMAIKTASGINIGGAAAVNFTTSDDGETLKVFGSTVAHYGVAQSKMTEEVWASQRLNAPYIMWTSSVSKDEDPTVTGKVLGPDVIGKALTTEVPRWFEITARLDVLPAAQGKPERHILYLGNHIDVNAGNTSAVGNTRMPLDAPPLAKNTIEPASIVEALKLLDSGGRNRHRGYPKAVWSMTPLLLNEFRAYLKTYKAAPVDVKYTEHVEVLNGLIPAFVDAVKDEELMQMIELMCDYIFDQILQPPAGEPFKEEAAQAPIDTRLVNPL